MCVWFDWVGFWNSPFKTEYPEKADLLDQQLKSRFNTLNLADVFFRCKSIVLAGSKRADGSSYFDRLFCLHGFSLSTFTQRIVNSDDPEVNAHMTPEWLIGFVGSQELHNKMQHVIW